MATPPPHHRKHVFDRFSTAVTRATGSSYAFLIASVVVVLWALTGPIFDYSNTWQLVINTGTTIITFLMVFVIQQSQNKDTLAIQLKLNELIASDSAANNRLVDIEDLNPEELAVLKKFYVKLARLALTDDDVHASHSLDEAEGRHQVKRVGAGKARTRAPEADKADKTDKADKADTVDKADTADKADTPDTADTTDKADETDKAEP